MRAFFLALAMFAAWPLCASQCDEHPLQVVIETYDAVCLLAPPPREGDSLEYEYSYYEPVYVVFIRDGKVIATRTLHDQMHFTGADGKFCLHFDDYGMCHRAIFFGELLVATGRWRDADAAGMWFNQNVRMTDLKEPDPK